MQQGAGLQALRKGCHVERSARAACQLRPPISLQAQQAAQQRLPPWPQRGMQQAFCPKWISRAVGVQACNDSHGRTAVIFQELSQLLSKASLCCCEVLVSMHSMCVISAQHSLFKQHQLTMSQQGSQ